MPQRIESAVISVTIGDQGEFPACLDDIIETIGARVTDAHCRGGFTYFQATGPVIYLSKTEPNASRRLILAHEVAHILLRYPAAIRLLEERGQASADEEELANLVAGALLVPDAWIGRMREKGITPALLQDVAYRAGITVPMLVTRIESAGIDAAVLHWRRGGNSWQVIDRPGAPASLHGRIHLTGEAQRALEQLDSSESQIVLDCCVSGLWGRIEGRGYSWGKRGENVFQFLLPRYGRAFTAVPAGVSPGVTPIQNVRSSHTRLSGLTRQTFGETIQACPTSSHHFLRPRSTQN